MEAHFASLNNLDNKFSNGDGSEEMAEPEYRMSLIQSIRASNLESIGEKSDEVSLIIGTEQLL